MGPWEAFEHGRHGYRAERGDLKYVILDLLEGHPSYGYEIIRALEERFHGFYSPSPGTVYPTLQWLEDLAYVTAAEREGRKVYTITEEGRRFLMAQRATVDEIKERMRGWWGPFNHHDLRDEIHDLMHDLRDFGKNLTHDARWADPDKLRRVQEVVRRASREIEDILREPRQKPADAAPAGDEPPKAA